MSASSPLPTLLSRALVAYTIEFDNAFESRLEHRTTDFGGPRGAVWAVSLRQWANCMRAVEPDGVSAEQLERSTGAQPRLNGMRRWGYVRLAGALILPTRRGRRAQAVWAPLAAEIDARWRGRCGDGAVDRLRAALAAVEVVDGLPRWLTFRYGGFAHPPLRGAVREGRPAALYPALSRALHSFALAYEEGAAASLQHTAVVLALLGDGPVALAELPARSGVGIDWHRSTVGQLERRGLVVVGPADGRRGRAVGLSPAGRRELARYRDRVDAIEAAGFAGLRAALAPIVEGDPSPLWAGLEPPPDSWRARVRRPAVLPAHPAPRQGGHPDGT